MRYSRGNRGNPGRQWGERRYQAPPEVKRRYSWTTSLIEEIRWVPKGDTEVLRYELRCRECLSRFDLHGLRHLIQHHGLRECLVCTRKFEEVPT